MLKLKLHPFSSCPQSFPASGSVPMALRIRWPKYWSFSFSVSPSNEYSGLISFRIDWFDFLAVQGTLESLLQHHSSKASILWRSAFFTVHLAGGSEYFLVEQDLTYGRDPFDCLKTSHDNLVKMGYGDWF